MKPHERIQAYIREAGLKQCVVADKAGYAPRQFSLMMTGKKVIRLDDLEPKFPKIIAWLEIAIE